MSSHAGLTLIELMVTLAVAIVLLAIGIPAFQGLASSNRASTQANGLVTALNLARSEAISRGIPVAVCARASASSLYIASFISRLGGITHRTRPWAPARLQRL